MRMCILTPSDSYMTRVRVAIRPKLAYIRPRMDSYMTRVRVAIRPRMDCSVSIYYGYPFMEGVQCGSVCMILTILLLLIHPSVPCVPTNCGYTSETVPQFVAINMQICINAYPIWTVTQFTMNSNQLVRQTYY